MSDLVRVSPEEAGRACAWCGKTIADNTPVFGMGGKLRPGADLSEFEGAGVRMELVTEDRSVIAIVPPPDSDAARDGYDFMFMVCSEACGAELKRTLDAERELGDALFEKVNRIEGN
ncbi:MAG: hypothetical protein ACLFWL_06335 [Candidatus Brocadiia bacterium]